MNKVSVLLSACSYFLAATAVGEAANIVVGDDPNKFPLRWTDGACYLPIKNVRVGDTIEFNYGGHNVYKMKSIESFNKCDFSDEGAEVLSEAYQSPYVYTVTADDAQPVAGKPEQSTRSLYFACEVGAHCNGQQKLRVDVDISLEESSTVGSLAGSSRSGENIRAETPVSEFVLGANADTCALVQNGEDVTILNRFTESECSDPEKRIEDYGREMWFRSCLSPPITLTPGGVVNQAILMKYPFPVDRRVLIGRRIWEFLQGDLDDLQPVHVNQLYVHHLLGGIVLGNGAESIRRSDEDAPFPPPYGKLSGDFNDRMVFHLIDLRETGDEWLECAECRCKDSNGTYLEFGGSGGDGRSEESGGIDCCSNCTSLTTPTVDYRLRYNVSWSEISETESIRPIIGLTADIALALGKTVEFDVPKFDLLPVSQRLPDDPTVQFLERTGKISDLFVSGALGRTDFIPDSTDSIEVHRCTGHMHIGGLGMWLQNMETGEVICHNNVTYGENPITDKGFLIAVGTQNFDPPVIIPSDTQLRIVTHYNASELHTGVMGLFSIFVAEHQDGHHIEVGPKETELTVELCTFNTCNPTLLPSIDSIVLCQDALQTTRICTNMGICDCDTFLAREEVTGCGGVMKHPRGGDIPVERFCAKTCGCQHIANEKEKNKIIENDLKKQFNVLYNKWCRYSSSNCQQYLSNLYTCAEKWEEFNIDPLVRDAIFKEGTRTVLEHAKLGDEAMHRFESDLNSPINQNIVSCEIATADLGNTDKASDVTSACGKVVLDYYVVGFLSALQLIYALLALVV